MADFALILAEGTTEPASFGFITATGWVSIAMALFIAILLWKKVPAIVAGMLDNKIAEISRQLNEAEALRLEAESLKAEYEAKLASAAKEADDMRARADAEAEALVAKAKADATALIARRKQMAEDRIAAAEASALVEVRTAAAKAATEAAAMLIADKHDAAADKALVDQAIAGVAKG
ncbi:F0F1 ATP synthase subunit B family protein [Sphingopyxis solisilvae]|uniref:F0F1 ATP synthase subunit B family protein n=1 Tax=Sphingopyxis solisilvae TaxID=1886788 RepID=UPI001892A596|nr:F0F1 ATP synthase subunit B [Sphingopyxis solisilvae]